MEIKKVFKKHSELLKLIKAYELLFDNKPKLFYKGYAIPWGNTLIMLYQQNFMRMKLSSTLIDIFIYYIITYHC